MSYSLAVRFKDEKRQKEMYQFYIANKEIIQAMSIAEGRDDSENFINLKFNEELSYSPKVKYLLGYEGSSGRPYYFELLLAWMAVKSSYRNKNNEVFLYYDNNKISIKKKNVLLIQVEENGIQSIEKSIEIYNKNKTLSFNLFEVANFEEYFKTLNVLFNMFENRWQKYLIEKI